MNAKFLLCLSLSRFLLHEATRCIVTFPWTGRLSIGLPLSSSSVFLESLAELCYTPGWRKAPWKKSVFPDNIKQIHKRMAQPGLKSEPFHLEYSALITTRPLCLKLKCRGCMFATLRYDETATRCILGLNASFLTWKVKVEIQLDTDHLWCTIWVTLIACEVVFVTKGSLWIIFYNNCIKYYRKLSLFKQFSSFSEDDVKAKSIYVSTWISCIIVWS